MASAFLSSSSMCLSVLRMLLTPKRRCAFWNVFGWVDGKYGAKTQSDEHFLLWCLQAAQAWLVLNRILCAGMDPLGNARVVRLKEHNKGKYLVANNDEKTLKQGRDGSSANALWTVEVVDGQRYLRLRSCHGKYLTASNMPLIPRGRCQRVVASLPDRKSSSTEWEVEGEGIVRLKTRYGQFLKQNGGIMPWRNSLVHNNRVRRSSLWEIEVVDNEAAAFEEEAAAVAVVSHHQRSVSDSAIVKSQAFAAIKFPNLTGLKHKRSGQDQGSRDVC
nr:uncharacterized protein LOC109180218 [Ipomoea batatas]